MWSCHAATILWGVGSTVSQLYVASCHVTCSLYIVRRVVTSVIANLHTERASWNEPSV